VGLSVAIDILTEVKTILRRSARNKFGRNKVINYGSSQMRMNKYIVNTSYPIHANLISSHCSGAILVHFRRVALPAVLHAVAVVLATGCASTGVGFSPLLIRGPLPAVQQSSGLEESRWNQPPRSPAFNDLVAAE
jgi:hypothetical protein